MTSVDVGRCEIVEKALPLENVGPVNSIEVNQKCGLAACDITCETRVIDLQSGTLVYHNTHGANSTLSPDGRLFCDLGV